jgi:hypothetical protein
MFDQVRGNATGGTTAGIFLESGRNLPELLLIRMSKVFGVSVPRLNFINNVEPLRLALNPSAHAGALPIEEPVSAVYHKRPSGPGVIPHEKRSDGNSVIIPEVVMRETFKAPFSENHNAPSGPVVISTGWLPAVGTGNSVITPDVVMRPMLLPNCSVNQSAPSGPAVIPWGPLLGVGTEYSVIAPDVVIRPIPLAA